MLPADLKLPLGFVAPLVAEHRCLEPLARRHPGHVFLRHSGIGPDRAALACRELLAAGANTLVSFGFAGGLDPALPPGTLVTPAAVTEPGGRVLGVRTAAREDAIDGVLISAPDAVTRVAEKRALFAATGAVAVDMESSTIGAIALEHGRDFAVVRAVLDGATAEVRPDLMACVDEFGHLHRARLVQFVLTRPDRWPELGGAARSHRRALRTLTAAVSDIAKQIDDTVIRQSGRNAG